MYQEQRIQALLTLVNEKNEVSAKEMMAYFGVSRDTIRRDFALLADEGKVQRTHGGIMKQDYPSAIASYQERLKEGSTGKRKIAEHAAVFMKTGGTYFMDVSTITLQLAQLVPKDVTIYSHSLDVAILLSSNPLVEFHLLGGRFFSNNRFYYALNEAEIFEHIYVDAAFIGAAGLAEGNVTYVDQEDAQVKKLVMKHAQKNILLAESEKTSRTATYSIGRLNAFDHWITDDERKIDLLDDAAQTQLTIV